MQSKYKQIIGFIRKGDVILFVGAGFSIKAGAPSGSDLCNLLYNALPENIQNEKSLKTEYTLQKLSETYLTHFGRVALADLLKSAFDFEPKDTSDQQLLAQIPHFKHIITTNYDSLLEDAYGESCNLVVTNSDLSQVDSRKPTIYKVHGDFSHPDDIVIAQRDYKRMYSQKQENLIWDTIRAEFSRHNVLFIGYSISDQNIQMLIEYIKEQMGESAKQLFVLTPDAEETAILQLKELGVEYIQGKAEDLFNELIPELKSHIVEDYEAKNTSVEDCDHFLREYDLQAGFELGGENTPNRLIALKSASGKDIQHTINLSLEKNRTESLPYYDERFDNLPLRKIADVRGFEYRANDILIRRDESKGTIYTYPIPKIGEICISIPQKQIIQKAPCRFYDNGFDQLQIDADADIGILEILIPILPNRDEGFRFRQKDRYTNNNTAIAWENLFSALFSGCQFSLTVTSGDNISKNLTYAFPKSRLKQERKESKQALQYYKYIREIELLMGCCFNEYENFSADNLFAAEIVYHYLKKEPLIIRHSSKAFEYKIEVSETTINPEVKKEFAFIESVQNVRCVLNGKEFKIPHMQRMYQRSILKSIKKNENSNIVLQFIDKAKEHRIQLTDKPLQIETEEGIVEV